MKRLLTLAAMFLCCLATTFAQFSGSGSGTENDPYLILNPIQLNQMRNFLNQEGVYFKLMADVDLTEFLEDENPSQGWQPVGTSSVPFKGVFDGNGHKIIGLWIKRPNADYVGLLGYTSGGTIKNVTIVGNSVEGKDFTGVISGYSAGTYIGDCNISGILKGNNYIGGSIGKSEAITIHNVVSSVEVEGKDYIGGILGQADGQGTGTQENTIPIYNCKVTCDIIKGNNYVGGLCGANYGFKNHMASCYVYADILGNDYIGGICGHVIYNNKYSDGDHSSADISNCSFWGNINANTNVGGISGEHSNKCTISNCSAICQIIATGDCVGGIVGNSLSRSFYIYSPKWSATDILNSYYCGSIYGNDMVGGITGYKKGGKIKYCLSISKVIGNNIVGGICGKAEELYNNGSSYGLILYSNVNQSTTIKAKNRNVGRIWGLKQGNGVLVGSQGTSDENKAYNRTIVIDQGVAKDVEDDLQNGTGVSATTLKLKATYVAMGWDFTDTWEIQETECYPYFKTQTAPPVITSSVVSGATSISGKCVSGATVTLEIDGVKKQEECAGTTFLFTVDPLQAGHEVRVSAKVEGKEQSYFTTEVVAFLGKGTEDDPYQISTAADLTQVYRKGYYKLMNDIDLTSYINTFSSTEGWESIGRDGSETIYFDGNGHKVTGLWCNSTRDNTGLFSCFANGYIKNLTVETASGKQVKGGNNTGILIGKMINGTIEDCRVSGTVADGTPVGGIVGLLDGGKILLSQASVTINTTGDDTYVGGLVGDITSGEIDQCVTLGTLTATGKNSQAGGMVGKNAATVTNSDSNVAVTSAYCAAGLIAYNYGLVETCYATGNLSSQNYGAGVIGYNDGENAIIRNCAAMNQIIDVTYESQSAQSGGYGQRIIGGIKNGAPAPELNNYALKTMQVSVNNVHQKVYDDIMNGVGKASIDMTKANTYQELSWDFSKVWSVTEGETYPSLKNNHSTVIGPPITLTAKNYTIVYGDELPTFEFTSEGATLNGTPSITCEATKTTPVGTYPIIISKGSVKNNNDYYVNGTLTITKAPLKITAKNYTIKQGEVLPTFEATFEGFKNNETETVLSKKPTITTIATSASNPGEYDITASGAQAQNYEMSYIKGKLTIIEADPVTVTAKSYTREYGEKNPTFEYTVEGVELKGKPEITCEATATSPVGTYPIVVKKGGVENFNDTYVAGTLTITKAPLNIAAGTYTKKQGEAMPEFALTYTGFKNNETENVLTTLPTISCEATEDSAPAEYLVTVSEAEAQNYDISYTNGKLVVTEATPVTITAKSYTRVYGDENPLFEYTVEGAAVQGIPEITCEATMTSPVGEYPIIINKGSVSNFNDSYVNGVLTITQAPLTITADDKTKKQGEVMPEFTLTYTGFKNNETKDVLTKLPEVSCEATEASAPGEYPITVSGAEAQNYDISYTNGKLIVTEADLVTIIAKSYTREYGDSNPVFEFSTEGATLEGTPTISCEAKANSPVGTYDIIVKQGSVTNYNVAYVGGTLTIIKAPLTVSVGDYSREQGQENPEFILSYRGWKNNEDESILITKPVATTTATIESPAGEYPITVSGGEAQNYTFEYANGMLTVTKVNSINALIEAGKAIDVYTVEGRKIRHQAKTLEGLPKGVYIIAGKKVVIK